MNGIKILVSPAHVKEDMFSNMRHRHRSFQWNREHDNALYVNKHHCIMYGDVIGVPNWETNIKIPHTLRV